MGDPVLNSGAEGLALAEVARLAAMIAGAVAGALAGWWSKRNALLALCAFMLGIIGGMWVGTGMGYLCYIRADGAECIVKAGPCALCAATLAGLAGAAPTALLIAGVITFLALRHVRQRPPPYRTALRAVLWGSLAGVLCAAILAVI
jgi:hypothetical protein